MGRALGGFIGQALASLMVFAINMAFYLIAGFVRSLPWLIPLVVRAFWRFIILSYQMHARVIAQIAPLVKQQWGINLLEGRWRRAATILLSLLNGLVLLLVLQLRLDLFAFLAMLPVGVWLLLLFVVHGWLVDRVWDEMPTTEGLQMGVRQ